MHVATKIYINFSYLTIENCIDSFLSCTCYLCHLNLSFHGLLYFAGKEKGDDI